MEDNYTELKQVHVHVHWNIQNFIHVLYLTVKTPGCLFFISNPDMGVKISYSNAF